MTPEPLARLSSGRSVIECNRTHGSSHRGLDESRGRPGVGLGLSIVSAVARVHRADLQLSDNGPGLRVEARFPGEAAAAPQPDTPLDVADKPGGQITAGRDPYRSFAKELPGLRPSRWCHRVKPGSGPEATTGAGDGLASAGERGGLLTGGEQTPTEGKRPSQDRPRQARLETPANLRWCRPGSARPPSC